MYGLLLTILVVQTEAAAVRLPAIDVGLLCTSNRYSWTSGQGTNKQWTRP